MQPANRMIPTLKITTGPRGGQDPSPTTKRKLDLIEIKAGVKAGLVNNVLGKLFGGSPATAFTRSLTRSNQVSPRGSPMPSIEVNAKPVMPKVMPGTIARKRRERAAFNRAS